MAYFWTDKIADVTYTNPELDTVKILWKDDMNVYREHYLKVDEEDEQFQALLEVTSYEDIEGRTKAANDIIRQEFKDAFDRYAERTGIYTYTDSDPLENNTGFFRFFSNFDPENAEDKERLFALKLSIFEKDEVKVSDTSERSKTAKTAIRKANSPVEILALYQLFRNENAEIHKDDEGKVTGVFVPFT
jgi:hypothetical protein